MSAARASLPSGWMRGGAAPVRGALLALALERPGHGGDLANRVQARLGQTWPVNGNDVYRLLEGLEAEGLIACRTEPLRSRHGARVVYHPTRLTADAVRQWMGALIPREPTPRSIDAKLAVARAQDMPALTAALRGHQRECLAIAQEIAPSEGRPRSWRSLVIDCAREGARRLLAAEIDWADRARLRIEERARSV